MREARRIAERRQARLTVLFWLSRGTAVGAILRADLQHIADNVSVIGCASGHLRSHIVRATGLGERDFHLAVKTGDVDDAVIASARQLGCDLIVIPGSVRSEKILRGVDCALLVVREGDGVGVLAATDLLDPTLPVLNAGQEAARWSRQKLTGMYSLNLAETASFGLGSEHTAHRFSDAEMEEMANNVRAQLRQAMRSIQAEGDTLVEQGPAADAILRAASRLHSHLIVVGSHHRGALPRRLGCVSESVASRAACSVLVTRHPFLHAAAAA
jgi:nucleotide-binding universal stress UspA family protein